MQALAVASLDEFVSALPLGLDTRVGDNGALFSGGERQRLGLARAILRGGRLLLLDEATSALDEETERQVLDNLIASGRAILMVTHRIHARAIGDRVFRLEEGSLIEESGGQRSAHRSSLASVLLN
jgi:ABC-type multidrug transport system fused ATPase/permease subunit